MGVAGGGVCAVELRAHGEWVGQGVESVLWN